MASVAGCPRSLGIRDFPRIVRKLPPDQIIDHVLSLHVHRRHLGRKARNDLMAALAAEGLSVRRIAEATGVPRATVHRVVQATGVPLGTPVQGKDGKTYQRWVAPAVPVASTRAQNRAQNALRALGDDVPGRLIDLAKVERLVRENAHRERIEAPAPYVGEFATITHQDFRDLDVAQGSVAAIITDPPYTVEAMREGVWADLGARAMKWLVPGGVVAAYAPIAFLPQAIADLASSGLDYYWTAAVVHQGPLSQITVRNVGNEWKPIVLFRSPGGPRKASWFRDVITSGSRSKDSGHPWEQPVAEAEDLMTFLTSPGGLVVDPFLGSGTVAVAAARSGRRFIGCDVSGEYVATAIERLKAETRSVPTV